jgi:ribosome-associated protein
VAASKVQIGREELHFSYSRSSGPGGQNVNKTNSKATLHWNLLDSLYVSADVKDRFVAEFGSKVTADGNVVVVSDETRDRLQNQALCEEKLLDMLRSVWTPPKKRKPTKPTKSSQRRRVEGKKQRGAVKSNRSKVKDW